MTSSLPVGSSARVIAWQRRGRDCALTSGSRPRRTTWSVSMVWPPATTEDFPQARMPEPQEGRQYALLQGSDDGSWPRQLAGPTVREWDSGVGRLLQLLQDQPWRLLEQLCHEFCLEGRPKDSTGTQHAEDVRGKPRPINRHCFLSRRRFV